MRRVAVLSVAIVLVTVAAVSGLVLASPRTEVGPDVSLTNVPNPTGGVPSVRVPEQAAYEGPRYAPPGTASPTTYNNQSKLWFHDGSWWAAMLESVTGQIRIHRLDAARHAWTDTGVIVDERGLARADVLWDGTHLYVASAGHINREGHAARINRFSYDYDAQRYQTDPNFPVTITDSGVEAINVARTTSGTTWVSYVDDGRLLVNHAVAGDLVWGEPFTLAIDGVSALIDEAAMVAVADTIAVVWTTETDEVARIAVHVEGAADGDWTGRGLTVDGLSLGDDQLSVTGSERRRTIYAVLRTSLDQGASRNRLAPQLVLLQFPLAGVPTAHLVGRVDDSHTHPIVLLDADQGDVYVVATAPSGGGAVYYKRSGLDEIAFASGTGLPLVTAEGAEPEVNEATSTKQHLTSESGLVVLAADREVGRYYYGTLSEASEARSPTDPFVPSAADMELVHDTFDGLRVGSPVPRSWVVEGAPPEAFSVAVLTGDQAIARLTGGEPDASVRACRPFLNTATGTLTAELEVLLNLIPDTEARLIELRGQNGEVASLRVRRGTLDYFDGEERVTTAIAAIAGAWYRLALVVDFESRTFDVVVRDHEIGSVLFQASDLAWRSGNAVNVSRICFSLPGEPDVALYTDNVRVTFAP